MANRGVDAQLNKFGFALQYNKLFKTEYLPGRVKYNQFFFVALLGAGIAFNKGKVSEKVNFRRKKNEKMLDINYFLIFRNIRCGALPTRARKTWDRENTTACPVVSQTQSPTAWTPLQWPLTLKVKLLRSEKESRHLVFNTTQSIYPLLFIFWYTEII